MEKVRSLVHTVPEMEGPTSTHKSTITTYLSIAASIAWCSVPYEELVEIAAKEAYLRDLLSAKQPGGMTKMADPDFSGAEPSFIAAYKERESELTKIREQKENLMKQIIKKLLNLSPFY